MPAEIAVVKCAAHKCGIDVITAGNRYADEMARYCATQTCLFSQGHDTAADSECVTEHLLTVSDK